MYMDNKVKKDLILIFNCVNHFCSEKQRQNLWGRCVEKQKAEMTKSNRILTGYHCSRGSVYKAEMTSCVPDHFICYHTPVGRSLWKLQKWLAYVNKVHRIMAMHLVLLICIFLFSHNELNPFWIREQMCLGLEIKRFYNTWLTDTYIWRKPIKFKFSVMVALKKKIKIVTSYWINLFCLEELMHSRCLSVIKELKQKQLRWKIACFTVQS